MVDAPERIWLSATGPDNEHEVWFDPDEGGTEYVRADLYEALELRFDLELDAYAKDSDLTALRNKLERLETENYRISELESLLAANQMVFLSLVLPQGTISKSNNIVSIEFETSEEAEQAYNIIEKLSS